MNTHYLTADEVTTALGISKGTLYSYVSRGLIRSEEIGGKTRAKRYNGADVQKLQQRQAQRKNPIQSAATALFFGDPVLESAITLIHEGELYYRGYNTLQLARECHFEQVAALLWDDTAVEAAMPLLPSPENRQTSPLFAPPIAATVRRLVAQGQIAEAFQMALLTAAPLDLAAYQLAPNAVRQTGLRLLNLLTDVCAEAAGTSAASVEQLEQVGNHLSSMQRIAQRLQQVWAPNQATLATVLDAALILCADHELNASSFTARCVASTGATPYAAVVAALAALQGYKHGGSTHEVTALLNEAAPDPARAVRERLRQGKPIPGFGHRLYPQGDPRAKMLLALARDTATHQALDTGGAKHEAVFTTADTLIAITMQATEDHPNLDFGLVVLAKALDLPDHAPFSLFALGRTAGWIGHILEQYELDRLIRPRAQYTGVQPRR